LLPQLVEPSPSCALLLLLLLLPHSHGTTLLKWYTCPRTCAPGGNKGLPCSTSTSTYPIFIPPICAVKGSKPTRGIKPLLLLLLLLLPFLLLLVLVPLLPTTSAPPQLLSLLLAATGWTAAEGWKPWHRYIKPPHSAYTTPPAEAHCRTSVSMLLLLLSCWA
jgi:hypothetical protein